MAESRRERERREEEAIMQMMDEMEADATRLFVPYADDPAITVRSDKTGHGKSVVETISLRLSQRKGTPLPYEDDPTDRSLRRPKPHFYGSFATRSQVMREVRARERAERPRRTPTSPRFRTAADCGRHAAHQRWRKQRQQGD